MSEWPDRQIEMELRRKDDRIRYLEEEVVSLTADRNTWKLLCDSYKTYYESSEAEVERLRRRLDIRMDTVDGIPTGSGDDAIDRLEEDVEAEKLNLLICIKEKDRYKAALEEIATKSCEKGFVIEIPRCYIEVAQKALRGEK